MDRFKARLTTVRCYWATLLTLCATACSLTGTELSPSSAIDQRPILSIGTHSVSSYLFNRYYQLFVESWQSDEGHLPSRQDTRQWLEHYLVQQVIIAHAKSMGYDQRPEVKHIVDRMQRHMLLDPHGPLFERICASPERSEKALHDLFVSTARQLDGIIAHFDNAHAIATVLGADFEAQTQDEQLRRLRLGAKTGAVQVFNGRLGWPFTPFSEIAPILEHCETGKWIQHQEPEFGTYFIYIRAIQTRSIGSFEHSRLAFAAAAREVDRRVAYQRHRRSLLNQAHIIVDGPTIDRLFDMFQSAPADAMTLPELHDRILANAQLYRYETEGREKSITVAEFRRKFNDAIVHRMPHSRSELLALVTDQALDDLDLALADAQHLEADPEFAERRAGFVGLQALDLFEREQLAPGIRVSRADIERYYRNHIDAFPSNTNVRGELFQFATFDAANQSCKLDLAQLNAGKGPKPSSIRHIQISRGNPFPELERFQELLLHSREGVVIGPLQTGRSFFLFVRDETTAATAASLMEVSELIRQRIMRQALDARERELAVAWCKNVPVEDKIDYQKLGLNPANIWFPWLR